MNNLDSSLRSVMILAIMIMYYSHHKNRTNLLIDKNNK